MIWEPLNIKKWGNYHRTRPSLKNSIRPTLPVSTCSPDPDTVSLPNSQLCGRHAPQAHDNREWRNDKHYDYPISRDHSYSATDNELANHDSRQSSARTSPAKLLIRAVPGRWFAAHDGRLRTRISIRSQDLFGWQGGWPLGLHQRSRVNLDFPCRAWNRFSWPTLRTTVVHKSRSKFQGISGMEPRCDRIDRIPMPRGYLIQPKDLESNSLITRPNRMANLPPPVLGSSVNLKIA